MQHFLWTIMVINSKRVVVIENYDPKHIQGPVEESIFSFLDMDGARARARARVCVCVCVRACVCVCVCERVRASTWLNISLTIY